MSPYIFARRSDAPEFTVTEGAAAFEQLSSCYEDAAEGDFVFRDLTLCVPAGKRMELVGGAVGRRHDARSPRSC